MSKTSDQKKPAPTAAGPSPMADMLPSGVKSSCEATSAHTDVKNAVAPPRPAKPKRARPLTLTALAAVPDDFGRLRFLLLDKLSSGKTDYSVAALKALIKAPNVSAPFRLRETAADGVIGEFWVNAPKAKLEYWLDFVAALRGREVTVTAKARPYLLAGRRGIALDIVDVEARPQK